MFCECIFNIAKETKKLLTHFMSTA